MKGFLRTPYVPERPVSLAIIGAETDPFRVFLQGFGVETIVLPTASHLDPSVRNHADLRVFHAGNGIFFCEDSALDPVYKLQPTQLNHVSVGPCYPQDCTLNIAWLRQNMFGLRQVRDAALCSFLQKEDVQWHPVRQGYANCSVCPAGANALITDDPSIRDAAERAGLDVLLVQKGDVRLSGHDYGFIGGASAMIGPRELVFFGDLSAHRDSASIRAFLRKHKCLWHDLPGVPLSDIGGIVPIR